MSEWTIVTVIVVLTGLMGAILKPIINLNSSITRLNESVSSLEKNIAGLTDRNSESHDKLWRKCDEHDDMLNSHETRLQILERDR